jgi:hypothetical protein
MRSLIILSAAMLATASGAFANPITIAGGGSLTCNGAAAGACQAFTGGGGSATGAGPTGLGILSGTNADTYAGAPASESDEAARLNILAGTSFSGLDGDRTDDTPDNLTFTTLSAWVVLKIGPVNIFIRNISGGLLEIAYTSSQGRGLSHYTEFGVVPLPAAGWLMLAGVAGLFGAQRRKKVAE